MKYKIYINKDECKQCSICVNGCPAPLKVLTIGKDGYPEVISPEGCFGCGICVELCPSSAIRIEGLRRLREVPVNIRLRELVKRII